MLTAEQIAHLAQLSRCHIDAADIPQYVADINNILTLVGSLASVNTSHISPISHPQQTPARLRPDEVSETEPQAAQVLAASPAARDNLFTVPQVIDDI